MESLDEYIQYYNFERIKLRLSRLIPVQFKERYYIDHPHFIEESAEFVADTAVLKI